MRKNKAQMLVLAGVAISVSVILLGAVSVKLSTVHSSVDNRSSDSIISEYRLLREKFGLALKNILVEEFDEENLEYTNILSLFEHTINVFYSFEVFHGYIFDAKAITKDGALVTIINFQECMFERNNEPDGMYVRLYLTNGEDTISEDVKYYI